MYFQKILKTNLTKKKLSNWSKSSYIWSRWGFENIIEQNKVIKLVVYKAFKTKFRNKCKKNFDTLFIIKTKTAYSNKA